MAEYQLHYQSSNARALRAGVLENDGDVTGDSNPLTYTYTNAAGGGYILVDIVIPPYPPGTRRKFGSFLYASEVRVTYFGYSPSTAGPDVYHEIGKTWSATEPDPTGEGVALGVRTTVNVENTAGGFGTSTTEFMNLNLSPATYTILFDTDGLPSDYVLTITDVEAWIVIEDNPVQHPFRWRQRSDTLGGGMGRARMKTSRQSSSRARSYN